MNPCATIRGAGPGPVRVAALERLLAELGRKEVEGKNWGPFIRRVAAPFLTAARLASYAPGGTRAGRLAWCAFTVCAMILEELQARLATELVARWKRLASGSCEDLFENLHAEGWAWRRGAPLPAALSPQGVEVPGLPAAGDLVFYGVVKPDGDLDLHHVDFYKAPAGGEDFDSAGGNTGDHVDAVDVIEHRGPEKVARAVAYARVPW